jgi:hypothetical protein
MNVVKRFRPGSPRARRSLLDSSVPATVARAVVPGVAVGVRVGPGGRIASGLGARIAARITG